jgi:hypothetical protein
MRRTLIMSALALTLVAGACSSGDESTESSTTTDTPTTEAPEPTTTTSMAPVTVATVAAEPTGPVSPLNGLPADDPDLLDRRVMAVKIDNHANARPQSGINEADAVYELLVEADLTRFIAMFHDGDSEFLGPMRSGRPTDPTLLRPLGATFTISGAQPWVIGRIAAAGVPLLGEIRPETFRVSFRSAPHNLYANTVLLREAADRRDHPDDPPPDMFAWGELDADTESAESIAFDWSSATKITWDWDGEQYLRSASGSPHNWRDSEGEEGQIAADTLVVLMADRYTASPSGSGSAVPAFTTTGSGRALVFANGLVAEGTWSRDSIEETFELSGPDGSTLHVPPGMLWVNVFPDNRTITW